MEQVTDHTHKTEVIKPAKQPLLTWKSFLASALIILVVYLIVNSFVEKDAKSEETTKKGADGYEYTVIDGEENSDNSILAVHVQGVILTETSAGGVFDFLGEGGATYGYDVKDELKRATKDDSIKAVVLEINSPGGTIPGSKAISDGVAYYKKTTGNPVYAHISDMGASGGYWAAVSADKVYAELGSEIGSIGVIMGPFKYYDKVISEGSAFGGVQTENGIDSRYITAGQYKDTGSPYRKLSDEETAHWQLAIDNEYSRFVEHVAAMRKLDPVFIRNTVKALPYETKRAKALGLIDGELSREAAIEQLATAAGLTKYNVIEEQSISDFFGELFGNVKAVTQPQKQSVSCSWCSKPLMIYDSSYALGQ